MWVCGASVITTYMVSHSHYYLNVMLVIFISRCHYESKLPDLALAEKEEHASRTRFESSRPYQLGACLFFCCSRQIAIRAH